MLLSLRTVTMRQTKGTNATLKFHAGGLDHDDDDDDDDRS